MRTLWAASLRHLLRHPAQLALALVGLSVGVATIVAVDIATGSSQRAFELSMQAVNGAATHQVVGGPEGIDERLYVRLQREGVPGVLDPPAFAPVIEGYVSAGGRDLQLLGLDPFAAAELNARADSTRGDSARTQTGFGPTDALKAPDIQLARWFTQPGSVVMASDTARDVGVKVNESFTLDIGGRKSAAVLVAQLQNQGAGFDSLLLTDIAQAQEWLGLPGRLSRIDVRVANGPDEARTLARIRSMLPPGVRLEEAQSRAQQSLDMTAAFTTNLKAMSLLALLVSTLLIYGAISFAVVQRRRIIGILRALGATRSDMLAIVLAEAAALGVVGAVVGVVAGMLIGRELVSLVSRTINDLYFVVAVNETVLPAATLVKALLAGIGTSLAAALLPALEVVGSTPQLGLRRSVLEERARGLARQLVIASAALAVGAGVIILISTRSLFAGFVALFMLLLSVAALTPALLRWLARGVASIAGRTSPVARLAFGDVAASLSRTGVAVAALGMAVAAMIGVSIMVASFRESLHDWLAKTMIADIYVTAPGPGAARPERRLDPQVMEKIVATSGVADYGMTRGVTVDSKRGPVAISAVRMPPAGRNSFQLVQGEGSRVWSEFDEGAVLISEPLSWRLQLKVGDGLTLSTGKGDHTFPIAGVFRAYGNDRGNAVMNIAVYRSFWSDDAVTGLSLYLDPHADSASVLKALRAAARGKQTLLMGSNVNLRAVSMDIFDRTFVITRVLNWLAAGVAAIGLVSSLLAWELERSRELAIVRALGLTPAGAAGLIETQTGFMGLAALLAAIPAGLLTALVLIDVINRRAFGWQIDLHLNSAQFTNALLLSVCAALAAGLYPAWRTARASISADIREE